MNDKVGRGSLRSVEPKSERSPSYKGSLTIGTTNYWLSGWRRLDDETGKYWLSLSVEAADTPAGRPVAEHARNFDDEIPF